MTPTGLPTFSVHNYTHNFHFNSIQVQEHSMFPNLQFILFNALHPTTWTSNSFSLRTNQAHSVRFDWNKQQKNWEMIIFFIFYDSNHRLRCCAFPCLVSKRKRRSSKIRITFSFNHMLHSLVSQPRIQQQHKTQEQKKFLSYSMTLSDSEILYMQIAIVCSLYIVV